MEADIRSLSVQLSPIMGADLLSFCYIVSCSSNCILASDFPRSEPGGRLCYLFLLLSSACFLCFCGELKEAKV